NPRLREREFPAIDVGEVPLADDPLVRPVNVPTPAVETALEFAGAPLGARGSELGAAMQARVVIGADGVLGGSCDDERIRADVIDVIVADFRDVLLATGELPRARP